MAMASGLEDVMAAVLVLVPVPCQLLSCNRRCFVVGVGIRKGSSLFEQTEEKKQASAVLSTKHLFILPRLPILDKCHISDTFLCSAYMQGQKMFNCTSRQDPNRRPSQLPTLGNSTLTTLCSQPHSQHPTPLFFTYGHQSAARTWTTDPAPCCHLHPHQGSPSKTADPKYQTCAARPDLYDEPSSWQSIQLPRHRSVPLNQPDPKLQKNSHA